MTQHMYVMVITSEVNCVLHTSRFGSEGANGIVYINKTFRWIVAIVVILSGFLVLLLVSLNLENVKSPPILTQVDTAEPTYQSECITTVFYNAAGRINYKLVANHVEHFSEDRITCFTFPIVTMFNQSKAPTWIARADRAKLTQDKILYLYGHVQINSTSDISQIKCITTNNAIVNLVTQDVSSNEEVILYGADLISSGMKLRGNLRNKTAELLGKVKTSYEINKS